MAGESSRENDLSWVPQPGAILAGRYRMGPLLGSGGMGAVVGAEHVQLHERVAIKFLHPDSARDEESKKRFVRESRISSLIKCEHVVRVLDVGTTEEGLLYLVMEYLEGEDLSERIDNGGPQPIQLAVDCVLQAAEALALAHAAGVVHRDIKPSNLWLSTRHDGTPLIKVLDFGISKLMVQGGIDPSLTETSSVFGSPTYMSPEQIRSAKRVDARADVWAVGVVLYELLTGSLPFEGDNVGGILASITADPPIRPRSVRADIPEELEAAVLACLEKDPARRITLTELVTELRPLASVAGTISADRVLHLGGPPTEKPWRVRGSMSMTPPPQGASTLSASTTRIDRKRPAGLKLAGIAAAVVVALGAALWINRAAQKPEIVVTADLVPLPAMSPALAVPSPPVSVVVVAPVVDAGVVSPSSPGKRTGKTNAPAGSVAVVPVAPSAVPMPKAISSVAEGRQ